ncbi:MAG TPA: hypothetical protein VF266_28530 [Thermoanaerobaculia bacterium]
MTQIRFRSSPDVELRQLGELAPEQRQAFAELESDPDFYGLFVPRPPLAMNLKSVGRQTAELFRALATPAPLDESLLHDEEIVDLVLDGILEVEHGPHFVSGADAFSIVCPMWGGLQPASQRAEARSTLLSREALLYAQDLEGADPQTLSTALYLFNRIPLTPFWKSRFSSAEAILAHLGADRGSLRALLEREWTASAAGRGWIQWSSRTSSRRDWGDVTWKLYVSVRPERIRDAFEIVARVLAGFPGVPFKIGDSASGLLRSDKLVTYFRTREELDAAAAILGRELAGCEAQGVPFSAGLDESGLLSWGVDPPEDERVLRWLGRDSWRSWLVKRLGAALAIAKCARREDAVEPWRFAIERARRHGIDVDTWTPSATLWSRA